MFYFQTLLLHRNENYFLSKQLEFRSCNSEKSSKNQNSPYFQTSLSSIFRHASQFFAYLCWTLKVTCRQKSILFHFACQILCRPYASQYQIIQFSTAFIRLAQFWIIQTGVFLTSFTNQQLKYAVVNCQETIFTSQ